MQFFLGKTREVLVHKWYVGVLVFSQILFANSLSHSQNSGTEVLNPNFLRSVSPHAKMYNGTPSNFEQVVHLEGASGNCSGTLVSASVIVTAAHCVNGLQEKMSAKFLSGDSISVDCKKSAGAVENPPGTDGEMSRAAIRNDLAACVLTRRVTTIKPACVGKPLQKGQPVLYAGYGLNNQGESVFYDGKQRQGILPLLRRVGGIITTYSRNIKEMMDAAIGSGDSGGFTGKKDEMGQLWISGVVSASTSEKAGESSDPVMNEDSYNSSVDLASATSQRFLTSFTREKGVEICGIGESSPEPTPPSPNFTPTPGPSLTPAPTPSVTSAPTGTPPSPNLTPLSPSPTPTSAQTPQPPSPNSEDEDDRAEHKIGLTLVDDFADVGVGFVIPDSLAATVLKLKTGDQILSLNGKKMTSVPELRAEIRKILQGTERVVTFTVLGKNGKSRERSYSLPTDNETRRSLIFGFYPKSLPRVKIADVTSGSEAETQGIKPNETLRKVNGLAVTNSAEAVTKIRALVQDHSETKIRLTVADEKGKARDVFVNLP